MYDDRSRAEAAGKYAGFAAAHLLTVADTPSRWDERFTALQAFVARTGNARVPQLHVEGDVLLGRWVNRQREQFAAGTLRTERANRLESLPGWIWNAFDAKWEERFDALAAFVAREGHASVPRHHVESGLRLTGWVARQREAYREDRLSADRVERLESLDGWNWGRGEMRRPSVSGVVKASAAQTGMTPRVDQVRTAG